MIKSLLAFVLSFIFLSGITNAQPLTFHSFSASENPLPVGYRHFLLPTGLELLTVQDSASPVVTLHTVVRGFDKYENAKNDGAAWLIARMLAKANQELFLEEMVWDEARQSGILFHTQTEGGNLHVHMSFPPRSFEPAISWLRSVLDGPIFDPGELAKEMKSVAIDLQAKENNAEFYLFKDLAKGVWGGKVFQKGILPTYASVSKLTPQDLKDYANENLRPDRTLIMAGGWVDPEQFKNAMDIHFAGWELNKNSKPLETEPIFSSGKIILRNELAREPVFLAGWVGPGVKENPRAARSAEVFSYMASLPGSPLWTRFVSTGLATEVSLDFQPGPNESLLLLRIKAEEKNAVGCLKAADLEVEKLQQGEYCADSLLDIAAVRLAWGQRFSQEKTSTFLPELGNWWAWSGRFERLDFEQEIGLLTGGDLRNFSRKFLDPYEGTTGMLCTSQTADEIPQASLLSNVGDGKTVKNGVSEPKKDTTRRINLPPQVPTFRKAAEILANYRINFEINSFSPDEKSRKSLAQIAQFLNKYEAQLVYLDGHADTQGDANYNMILSQRRADAVKQYLIENFKVNSAQLITRAFGETMPAFSEEKPENMAKNRRIEVSPVPKGGKR